MAALLILPAGIVVFGAPAVAQEHAAANAPVNTDALKVWQVWYDSKDGI